MYPMAGQRDEHRRHLRNAEHENDCRQHARPGDAGDEQADADDDGLDESDAEYALGDRTDGRRGQIHELRSARPIGDSLEDRTDSAGAGIAEGHHDAGDGEGGHEQQQSTADAGHEAQRRLGEVADLRLHALHQCRKIGVGLRPEGMHLLPDQWPAGDAFSRRRYLQGVVLDVVDEAPYRVAERAHERGGRHHDDHDSQQHQQRRRKPLTATQLRGDRLLQGIETDGQDQRPGHEVQERRKHLKAQHDDGQDQAGANQDVQKERGQPLLELGIEPIGCIHGASLRSITHSIE